MSKISFEYQFFFGRNKFQLEMNFIRITVMVAIITILVTAVTARKGFKLHHKGFINVAGRLDYAGLSPKEIRIIKKYIAAKRCQKYGRFC